MRLRSQNWTNKLQKTARRLQTATNIGDISKVERDSLERLNHSILGLFMLMIDTPTDINHRGGQFLMLAESFLG